MAGFSQVKVIQYIIKKLKENISDIFLYDWIGFERNKAIFPVEKNGMNCIEVY